jgi:hypothetical protein
MRESEQNLPLQFRKQEGKRNKRSLLEMMMKLNATITPENALNDALVAIFLNQSNSGVTSHLTWAGKHNKN